MPERQSTRAKLAALNAKFGRVDYGRRIRYFDQAIKHRGYKVILTPAVQCPCTVAPRDGGTGVPAIRCPDCGGLGRLYLAQTAVETRALAESIVMDPRPIRPEGYIELGTLRATFPGGTTLAYWDRVLFPDVQIRNREVRRLDPLKPPRIALRFEPTAVEFVMSRNPATRQVFELDAASGHYMLDDTTNELVIDRNQRWFYPDMPVSIVYRGTPYYYVVDGPHEFRGAYIKHALPAAQWVDLPVMCVVKRADLVEVTSGTGEQ